MRLNLGLVLAIPVLPLIAASVAGVSWNAPPAWKTEGARPMRAATYTVPAAAGDREGAECAVFYFGQGQGGSVEANITRWLGQFEGGQSAKAAPTKKTINGLQVTIIEHAGTYLAGAPMGGASTPKPGYRMIGAIVEAPQGNVFFKITGPSKTVEAAKPAWEKMLGSIKKGS